MSIAFSLVLIAWFIWRNAGFRDYAIRIVNRHCQSAEVQLLDDTVSLTRLRLERDSRGNIALARYYSFEFTVTGERRYQGQLELFGRRVRSLQLQAHRIH